jgi:dethiobiotin synthetase
VKGVFVAGTDTGVGKTLAATALLHALRRRHARVVGMKPVAAGAIRVENEWASEDALALRGASSIRVSAALDNPVLLPEPISPHLAAERAKLPISIPHIVRCYKQLQAQADFVVVEGAGGFLVPLGKAETGADLAKALKLPVLLVVGLRLGCLNHALLTAEAIRARGLILAGWICNRMDPSMLQAERNIAYLWERLSAPLVADIAYSPAPDPENVSVHLPPHWP